MIHAICDFCGKDCERTATLLTLTLFQNFARYHNDHNPNGHVDDAKSFVICHNCATKHELPNPFHTYASTSKPLAYDKYLDNYTNEDFKNDIKEERSET